MPSYHVHWANRIFFASVAEVGSEEKGLEFTVEHLFSTGEEYAAYQGARSILREDLMLIPYIQDYPCFAVVSLYPSVLKGQSCILVTRKKIHDDLGKVRGSGKIE